MQQGLEQGRLEGKREGRLEGKIEGLERLLVKRFGPLDEATRKRLELDRWTDCILDASTVDAVLEKLSG